MMMNHMNEMMNGGMGLMMQGMVLDTTLWILLLAVLTWALIIWLNRRWGKPGGRRKSPSPKESTAQELLSQRYGGGEIDQATGEQMREKLGATSPLNFSS
jgi:uncharacterized membrane protein